MPKMDRRPVESRERGVSEPVVDDPGCAPVLKGGTLSHPGMASTIEPARFSDRAMFLGSDGDTDLCADSLHSTVDPSSLPKPTQICLKPSGSSDLPSNSLRVRNQGSAESGDATTASKKDRGLRTHHSSSTVLMLENALTAVRNDASQLPLSDLVHASTMVRDLETVLREKLTRNKGNDGKKVDSAGTAVHGT